MRHHDGGHPGDGERMVRKVTDPAVIPAPGNKTIEEYFGNVRTGTSGYSVAHMIAPSGWSEPFQVADFDELTIVIKGVMRVEHESGLTDVSAGEVVLVTAGDRIRYCNPTDSETEYWAVCIPAFGLDLVERDE